MLEERLNEWVKNVVIASKLEGTNNTYAMMVDVDKILSEEFDKDPVFRGLEAQEICTFVSLSGETPIDLKERVKIKMRNGHVYKGQVVNVQKYCLWIKARRTESPIPIILNRIETIEKL